MREKWRAVEEECARALVRKRCYTTAVGSEDGTDVLQSLCTSSARAAVESRATEAIWASAKVTQRLETHGTARPKGSG